MGRAVVAGIAAPIVFGTGIDYLGQKSAQETREKGVEAQLEIEDQRREFTGEIFDKQQARQQPFVDVGKLALPELIKAVRNEGDASNLPSANIRRDIVGEFLGEMAPEFVKDKAFGDINAEETEVNKNRLSNLVNLGVGGAGNVAQTGASAGADLSRSLTTEANVKSQSLQDAANARTEQNATILRSLSALPALTVAARRR